MDTFLDNAKGRQIAEAPWLFENQCDWSFVKNNGIKKHYRKGATIQPSDLSDSIVYIDAGRIRFSALNADGEEKIILITNRGNLINVHSFAGEIITDSFIYTVVKDCILYEVKKDLFIEILKSDSEKALDFTLYLSKVIKILTCHVGDMAFMQVPSRVAKYLYMLCKDQGSVVENGIRIDIKFTHYEMGIYVGASRVTVSNILNKMERDQIIYKENGYYIVKNMEKLIECII